MEAPKIEIYLGSVREVIDRTTYEITADIPGVAQEIRAYPYSRGEMDEPVSGNLIYLMSLDPVYHSLYLYTKVKENDFIGIRSNGKMLDITPDYVSLGVYDSEKTSPDEERPDLETSYVKMDSSGNIEIMATGDKTVKVDGDAKVEIGGSSEVKISGSSEVKISGDAKINVSGNTTLTSTKTTLTGGQVVMKGMSNTDLNGPFNAIKVCPFTGAPHCGSQVTGT